MMPEDFAHMALWWGPGVLLLLAFSYGFLRLAQLWIERTMDAKRRQMESVFGMAEHYLKQFLDAQRSQAEALSRLASSVEQSDSRDSLEHQQILVALRAMHRDMERMVRQTVEIREEQQSPRPAKERNDELRITKPPEPHTSHKRRCMRHPARTPNRGGAAEP